MAEGGLIQLEEHDNPEGRRERSIETGLPSPVEPDIGRLDKAEGENGLPSPVDPDIGRLDKPEAGVLPQDITDQAIGGTAEEGHPPRERIRTSEIEAGDGSSSGVAEKAQSPHIKREYTFKVIIIGDPGTGKTSLARRYCENKYEENYKMTIGIDFFAKNIVKDGVKVSLRIFDIGSQEHTRLLTRAFYKQASGVIICYDITNQVLLNAAASWKMNAEHVVRLSDGRLVPCLLVGTKVDLLEEAIPDNDRIMADFVDCHKFISWVETSAKENIGVDDAFTRLTDEMIRNYNKIEEDPNHNLREDANTPSEAAHIIEDVRPRRWNERCSC